MTHLELVTNRPVVVGPGDGPFEGTPLPRRLPPGRHGIPANLVVEHQRRRLIASMLEALAAHGYAGVTTTHVSMGAGVSTSTFYKHFGNLWDCALAAYVASADHLCERIEAACAARDPRAEPLAIGIDAALSLFVSEPALAKLLSTQPPLKAPAIGAARRLLISRLAAMLRRDRESAEAVAQPLGLDERLIDATLAFICARIAAGEAASLTDLGPELTAILDRNRCAA
jgi:AcrR family transcriptional regulator